jgi:hypothetical protein
MASGEKEGANGERIGGYDLELDHNEKRWVTMLHERHRGCELSKCYAHAAIHLLVRVEAARARAEWQKDHGIHYGPETCPDERHGWRPVQWVNFVMKDWGDE